MIFCLLLFSITDTENLQVQKRDVNEFESNLQTTRICLNRDRDQIWTKTNNIIENSNNKRQRGDEVEPEQQPTLLIEYLKGTIRFRIKRKEDVIGSFEIKWHNISLLASTRLPDDNVTPVKSRSNRPPIEQHRTIELLLLNNQSHQFIHISSSQRHLHYHHHLYRLHGKTGLTLHGAPNMRITSLSFIINVQQLITQESKNINTFNQTESKQLHIWLWDFESKLQQSTESPQCRIIIEGTSLKVTFRFHIVLIDIYC